jgi:hypothetical protein
LQVWDYTRRGIDNSTADLTSKAMFVGCFVAAAAAAI